MTFKRITAFGMSLSIFFAISYILCVLFDLWVPKLAMHEIWQHLLPGFEWLTWPSFFIGLIEVISYGWYVALLFGSIFYLLLISRKMGNMDHD